MEGEKVTHRNSACCVFQPLNSLTKMSRAGEMVSAATRTLTLSLASGRELMNRPKRWLYRRASLGSPPRSMAAMTTLCCHGNHCTPSPVINLRASCVCVFVCVWVSDFK